MASASNEVSGNASNSNGSIGKRKKSRSSKGSYLSKWLDKSLHHIEETTHGIDTYDTYVNPNINWQVGSSQFAPGFDPYKHTYGSAVEPVSLPMLSTYYHNRSVMPMYDTEYRYMHGLNKTVQVQKLRPRRRTDRKAEETVMSQGTPGCLSTLQPNNLSNSQDFASLPPVVTSIADIHSNSDMNTNEKDDVSNARRYSDPCVRGLPDVARPANEDVETSSESSSGLSGSQVGSRLLTCLLDQIASLKLANERLNKDLLETKAELENMRHHNIILQKGSSSSIGATPNHSLDNGMMGQYSPGFLTDLVREIRDAARLREEALYSRVRALVLERTDNGLASSEVKFMEKDLEEIKSSLRASEADKCRMMDRIVKLEDELRSFKLTTGSDSTAKVTNGIVEDADAERTRLRKEVADLNKAKQNAEEHAFKGKVHLV